ncbi:MAG: GMC family oxidoreductase N-terminal domain-containing protein [Pseudonocardiaceae bacterium]
MTATEHAVICDDDLRRTLEQLCDTFVPAVGEVDESNKHPVRLGAPLSDHLVNGAVSAAFLSRPAAALNTAAVVGELVNTALPVEAGAAITALLARLYQEGFAGASIETRTARVHRLWSESGPVKQLVRLLRALTMLVFYGLPTESDGSNPNWTAIGYPGPISPPPATALGETVQTWQPAGEVEEITVDACVVGSGAGGSVIAGVLARAGLSVAVLERGAYYTEADFDQRELPGYQRMWLGDGLVASVDGSLNVLAGSCLGGGTTINYMVCLPPPGDIRAEWESMGLKGVAGPEFDADIDAVSARIGVNTAGTVHNGTNQLLRRGAAALGRNTVTLPRNCSPDDDPSACGYCAWGCQRGAKMSTTKTWLLDASRAGALIVTGCEAERITTESGRATGVVARVTHPDGGVRSLRVRAATVVAAAGSINNPALLLRSGIGGPAVGRHLRVHPLYTVNGIYTHAVDPWHGQPMSGADMGFARLEPKHGFLVETLGMVPAMWASALPWTSGSQHKQLMRTVPHMAPFVALARDHTGGTVTLAPDGNPTIAWSLTDRADRATTIRAHQEMSRMHEAAGAHTILTMHQQPVQWNRGTRPLQDFLDELDQAPYEANDLLILSAHQQGNCRLGRDARESVADGHGQLHDVKGVWIGDSSAFPTAVGVNPMLTVMALAHRTARAILYVFEENHKVTSANFVRHDPNGA